MSDGDTKGIALTYLHQPLALLLSDYYYKFNTEDRLSSQHYTWSAERARQNEACKHGRGNSNGNQRSILFSSLRYDRFDAENIATNE